MRKKLLVMLLSILIPLTIFASQPVGVIGDSISICYPIMPCEAYHAVLAKEFDWRVINYSYAGSTTNDLMPRLTHMLENDRPEIVFILLGLNDALFNVSFDTFYGHMQDCINLLRKESIPTFVGTVDISSLGWNGVLYSQNFHSLFNILSDNNLDVFIFPAMTTKLLLDTSYRAKITDPCHPNAKGHKEIADSIREILLKYPEKFNLH